MARIPVGLQLYTVRQEFAKDPKGTIKAVAEMGYEGVEGGPPAGMSNKEFLALLKEHKLKLAGGGTGVGEMMNNLPALVDRCKELGINTLMLGIGGELRREQLDRHLPPERGVLREEHLAHAPRAEGPEDPIPPELLLLHRPDLTMTPPTPMTGTGGRGPTLDPGPRGA